MVVFVSKIILFDWGERKQNYLDWKISIIHKVVLNREIVKVYSKLIIPVQDEPIPENRLTVIIKEVRKKVVIS